MATVARKPISVKLWLTAILFSVVIGGHAQVPVNGTVRTDLPPPAAARPGFSAVPPETSGVRFTNAVALQRHITNQIILNGSGVACGDVDGDGRVDLYFCNIDGPNALFRNLGGWRFEDITAAAGVACAGLDCTGAAFADLDGDGDLDLVVSSIGTGSRLFFNDGKGRFTASPSVLNGTLAGMSMALGDLDGNGTLDLYVANYRAVTLRDQPNTKFSVRTIDGEPRVVAINGRPLTDPDLTNRFTFRIKVVNGVPSMSNDEHGEPDAIFLNDGRGGFTPLPFTSGAFVDENGRPLDRPPFDWGLSVMIRDLNGDGSPDIYVCNDFKSPDRIWLGNGRGQFRALAATAIRQTCLSSMGVDLADVNRDGHFDIFVADMLSPGHQRRMTQKPDMSPETFSVGDTTSRAQTARNTLLLARGDGTFAEIAPFAGVAAADWAWTPAFLDVDLDGFEDLLIANGFERDGMNVDAIRELDRLKSGQKLSSIEALSLRTRFPRLATPNIALRNLGNSRFTDASAGWNFNHAGVSQGMALADLDNDGDLDVVINNMNGPAFLLRNEAAAPRVAVRLQGLPPNTRGIGAKITVSGGPVTQMQEMICGGRYLSSDDPMRVFAAGSTNARLRIEVAWRSGRRSVVENVVPNSLHEITEPDTAPVAAPPSPAGGGSTWFADESARLNHAHQEEDTDDFARQPLLPRKFSQCGPGVNWTDVDGDGRDDLALASGRPAAPAVFLNDSKGRFIPTNLPADSLAQLAAGRAGVAGANPDSISAPCAMADLAGHGALSLFVGGRAVAARHPEPAPSLLFQPAGGKFVPDPAGNAVLTNLGLVNSAVFSDLDGDGLPELIVACDWGPLKILRNSGGKLAPWNPRVAGSLNPQLSTLDHYTGWWNGVTTGDFDGDGRMDIVAANWGENTRFEGWRTKPLRLYHGDVDGDGVIEIVESYFDPASGRYVPARQLDAMQRGMPWLRLRFATWDAWSRASVEDVFGGQFAAVRFLEAAWLSSTVFLNRGDHFMGVRLPDEAQFAPAFGVCVADFDGDGVEDIFLAQNFFATTLDTSRLDAGRGLVLRGDGKGGFASVPGRESGVLIHGEQRGAAVADFDADGRVDLCAGQNGAGTKLLRNTRAAPGLRVRLRGPAGNPRGFGAVLRAEFADGTRGPAREIHAGSGWLSQDSAVAVLAAPRAIKAVHVRWPGGRETTSPVGPGAREIVPETPR
jgi:hypothetical protein